MVNMKNAIEMHRNALYLFLKIEIFPVVCVELVTICKNGMHIICRVAVGLQMDVSDVVVLLELKEGRRGVGGSINR